jgi:sugar fermentation stimulation protein A
MMFQTKLLPATLIKRYKRFLADVELPDGRVVTAHCANPGSMMGLTDAGTRVWIEPNDDPKKTLKFAWRLSEYENATFVCVDTSLANRMVAQALADRAIPELGAYVTVQPEVRYSDNSRIDFLLTDANGALTYVEVKSVTLSRQKELAEFPDSVTARGAKHLDDLAKMVAQGHRAVMLYVVQRTDCTRCTIAKDIDPNYARALDRARGTGVEILCYRAKLCETVQKSDKSIIFS